MFLQVFRFEVGQLMSEREEAVLGSYEIWHVSYDDDAQWR